MPRAILFGPLPPPYGGVAVFMSALKDACIEHGAEVWSYSGDAGDPRVKCIKRHSMGHIRRLLRLTNGVRVVDSTHFHLEYPHWLLQPAWLWVKRLRDVKWIKVCHDGSLPFRYNNMSAGERRSVMKAVRAVDDLVVTSPALVDFFHKECGREATFVSPLMPLPRSWDARANDVRASHEGTNVLSIGTFIPSYGFDHVAQAIDRLRQKGPSIKLILLDGGFARDDDYRRAVLSDRDWIEVHSEVPHHEVAKFLISSDVFVRAFAHESYGLSRVEAILSGTPLVATNIGETRGMLTYEFGDVDTLTSQIESILDARIELNLQYWGNVYRAEAEANLRTYLTLITGDANA